MAYKSVIHPPSANDANRFRLRSLFQRGLRLTLSGRRRESLVYPLALLSIILLLAWGFYSTNLVITLLANVLVFALGSISGYASKVIVGSLDIGLDFIPFSTIVFFYAHGFWTGMIATVAMSLLSGIISGSFAAGTITTWLAFLVVGFTSLVFRLSPFWTLMLLFVEYHIINDTIEGIAGLDNPNDIVSIPGNILLTFILFKYVAVYLLPYL